MHPHKGCVITQREVGVDTESWHAALKNTLRQAPDVILIGEIRDKETMEYGIQFAETGHLCLATLHANSANQALGPHHQLFPRGAPPAAADGPVAQYQGVHLAAAACRARAASAAIAAMEIMLNTPLIADLIFKGEVAQIKEIMAKSTRLGMQTFDQALFDLYEESIISYEEAMRNADSKNELRLQASNSKASATLRSRTSSRKACTSWKRTRHGLSEPGPAREQLPQ